MHLKNYINGKTTNERFSRKAQSSFSEDDSNIGTTTYMDGKSESESLMEGGGGQNSSRASIVLDDENGGKEHEKRKSTRASKRVNAKRPRRGCMENVSQMMCNHRIIT